MHAINKKKNTNSQISQKKNSEQWSNFTILLLVGVTQLSQFMYHKYCIYNISL